MATEKTGVQSSEVHPEQIAQLDSLLEQEDPGFAKALDDVKRVQPAADVQIEGTEVGDFDPEENPATAEPKGWRKFIYLRRQAMQVRIRRWRTEVVAAARTAPKEFALYLFSILKNVLKEAFRFTRAFFKLSRWQKIAFLLLGGLSFVTAGLIVVNLEGRHWLPALEKPMLTGFGDHASESFDYNPKDMIPFFRAFPQDPEIYLLPKLKVNLRRSDGHALPMGAFEIYLQLDSHETAIEVQSRSVEMHDTVQRVLEDQSYQDLLSELGKTRLKGLIKKEVSHLLTQGWVTDVHYGMFILKP